MSLRARYPLNTLIRLREHRTETARLALLERQRLTQACRDACTAIEGEIDQLRHETQRQRTQLMDPPPPGMAWPQAFAQREWHIEHLGERAVAARGRLKQAESELRKAEQAQDEARAAFFRARARQEALEKRRDVWQREQRTLESRREESNTAELMQGRRSLIHFT